MQTSSCDFLVIGSGLAGLAFALKSAPTAKIIILTKDKVGSANTPWAQGGVAAVMDKTDSFEAHINDTLRAGAGLCNQNTVENYVNQAPERITELLNWGVQFDRLEKSQQLDLTREGGHSQRRILHFEDHTGAEIHRALLHQCRQHPNISFYEGHVAIDFLSDRHMNLPESKRVHGVYALDKHSGKVAAFIAPETILSTGGAGKVYLYTSNWSGATGDGIAMAWRAGARVSNLEFMQFHPTCLYHQNTRNFLISEALRGEGGELINAQGVAFMKGKHEMGSLAPRDIVARSIDQEMKTSGQPSVFLDMTHKDREYLLHRFPVIFQKCLDLGIDISKDPIPVVPAAHYLCGGVVTDLNGRTDLKGLWALGETANSGFHGANRLASNSLLECLAMAHNCQAEIRKSKADSIPRTAPPDWIYPKPNEADEMIVITHMWDEIRTLMWNYMGIVRSNKRLERASHRLQNILNEVKDYYSNYQVHSDILELRNIAIMADLSVQCALKRKESRGIHFNIDYPWSPIESAGEDTIL